MSESCFDVSCRESSVGSAASNVMYHAKKIGLSECTRMHPGCFSDKLIIALGNRFADFFAAAETKEKGEALKTTAPHPRAVS
jgi:hypothetical protein